MAGKKGNAIGGISEAAVGLAMARVAREAGMTIDAEFDVEKYQSIINTVDYTNHAFVKARNYGDTLGCQIIQEMLKHSVDRGIDLTTVNFAFYNAATEDVHGAKTEDVIVRIRTKDDKYQEKQRYSVKCKTSSGNTIFGNGSGNTTITLYINNANWNPTSASRPLIYQRIDPGTDHQHVSGSLVWNLNAGDTVRIYGIAVASGTDINWGEGYGRFMGYLIS